MNVRNSLLVLLLCLLLGPAQMAQAELYKDRIAAVVNGDVILFSDLEKHKHPIVRNTLILPLGIVPPGKSPTDREILDELIVMHLLEQNAHRNGVTIEDTAVDGFIDSLRQRNKLTHDQFVLYLAASGVNYADYRKMMKRQFVLRKLIAVEVGQKIAMSEEDAQHYFRDHKSTIDDEYKTLVDSMTPARPPTEQAQPQVPTHETVFVGGRVRLRQMSLVIPPNADKKKRAAIIAKAKKIVEDVDTGADFAELAKKHSEDPYAKSGGDLGFMDYKDLRPELQKLVQKMKKGSVLGPFPTSNGLVIFYLADASGRTERSAPIPPNVRKEMEKRLKQVYEERAARAGREAQGANPRQEGTEPSKKQDSASSDDKKKPEKSLGILNPAEEQEYGKVRDKVQAVMKAKRVKERMTQWIEDLKKNSVIDVKL